MIMQLIHQTQTQLGAHRFKIALTLAKKEITTTDDDNFVDLLKIQDGVVESKVEKTDYNILEDTLVEEHMTNL